MSRANITMSGFELNLGEKKSEKSKRADGDCFNILLLGDFSGTPGTCELSQKRVLEVDRDNFSEQLERLNPRIRIPLSGKDNLFQELSFSSLDDFEPDAIFRQATVFQHLRNLRGRLQDPKQFASAAAELGYTESPSKTDVAQPAAIDMLDSIIDTMTTQQVQNGLESYIKQVVAPYSIPKAHPKTDELVSLVDTAITQQMRMILHHSSFKTLESNWRGLDMLVRRLETGNKLRVKLVDVNQECLSDDVTATDELEKTGLYKLLVTSHQTPGASPPSLVIGLYQFDRSVDDFITLARVGAIARAANISFVAAATTRFVHDQDLMLAGDSDDWQSDWSDEEQMAWNYLRSIPAARHLALIMPRYLLRLPYGKRTSPVESFDFEEVADDFESNDFLWGNSAYLAAIVFGKAFTADDWNLQLNPLENIDGLPVYSYRDAYGDTENLSCAETLLTEPGGNIIRERGLSVLWWVKNTDEVRLGLHSLAGTALVGRWSSNATSP